ncbi:MAG: hypothetical protein GXO09_00585 [Crenarchaeota archaeon]|nr:hypothetical protein [Thermoproteota archaeon]
MSGAAGSVAGAVLAELTRSILEKVRKGEKLSTEEIIVLLLDLNYRQVSDLQKQVLELYRQLDAKIEGVRRELSDRITALDRKVDGMRGEMFDLYRQLDRKIEATRSQVEETRRELLVKVDEFRREVNQRLDAVYQLLVRAAGLREG